MLMVGWWPFSFRPANNVSWLEDRAGLQFKPSGIVYDPGSPFPAPGNSPNQAAEFTIELWLKPDLEPSDGIYHVVTIDDGHLPSNLVLCQWKAALLLRTPASNTKRGFQEVGIDGALRKHQEKFITIVGDAAGTKFYADGLPARSYPRYFVSCNELAGRLILGNSAEGKHSWSGQVFGLAIFNRALDAARIAQHSIAWTNNTARQLSDEPGLAALFLFDKRQGQWVDDLSPNRHQLFVPSHYEVLHKIVLEMPWNYHCLEGSDVDDILINIFGFIPFGLCAFCFFNLKLPAAKFRSAWFAVGTGAALSLLIELVQVWLPNRSSSATDLVCNIGGTFLGTLLARIIWSKLATPKPAAPA